MSRWHSVRIRKLRESLAYSEQRARDLEALCKVIARSNKGLKVPFGVPFDGDDFLNDVNQGYFSETLVSLSK